MNAAVRNDPETGLNRNSRFNVEKGIIPEIRPFA